MRGRIRFWTAVSACALLLGVVATPARADDDPRREATTSSTTSTTTGVPPATTSSSSTSTTTPTAAPVADPAVEATTTPPDDRPDSMLVAHAVAEGTVSVVASIDGPEDVAQLEVELAGTHFEVRHVFDDLVALDLDVAALERAAASDALGPLSEDTQLTVALSDSTNHIGANEAWAVGLDGTGVRVAVIDSGVDGTHATFADAIDTDAEACFVSWGAVSRCGAGGDQDSAIGAGTSAPCSGAFCEHGTHVASIAVGRGGDGSPPGVARGAELIPIRIFGTNPSGGGMDAQSSDLIAALDHLITVDASDPIGVLNLSLGAGSFHGACDGALPTDLAAVAARIHTLEAQDVTVVAAVGNAGLLGQSMFPACLSSVVPVIAVGDFDLAASFSNVVPDALAAPGVGVLAAVPGGAARLSGSSMAAPQVSGAMAVLQQDEPSLHGNAMRQRLTETAAFAYNDLEFASTWRIDLAAALGLRPRPAHGMRAITLHGDVHDLGRLPDPDATYGTNFVPPEHAVGGARPGGGADGLWVVTNKGRVVAYEGAPHFGDASALPLNRGIIAMAPTPTGLGYYLLGEDGGVFTYGDAQFYGSTGNIRLNAPVTDLAVTSTGGGYWFTAMDGGVFTFGDAQFYGSTGNIRLNEPVVSIDATDSGAGYWLVALDGGIFAFGDAPFHGSLPGVGITNETGYRIRSTQQGRGYYIATVEGGIYPFGSANWFGHAPIEWSDDLVEIVPVEGP